MAQLVRLDKRAAVIARLFEENRKRMVAAAPRTTGDPARLFQVCFNMIAYDEGLLECTQQSLVGGVFEALKLGITLGGPMQEGWLIPFKEHGTPKATLIVGYMGYRNIIDRAGAVVDLHPRAVHNGRYKAGAEWKTATADEFDYWFGDNPRVIHKPRNQMPETREQLRAVYAVANLRRGGKQMEVLELEEVDAHRARSRAKDRGPWVTDFVPMALKTSIRKIAKYLPKSNELLARALDLDQRADLGQDQQFDLPPDVVLFDEAIEDPAKKAPSSPMERLKGTMGIAPPATIEVDPEAQRRNRELDAELAARDNQAEQE